MVNGKRILYVIDDASRNGGAHIATRRLIGALRRVGHQVDLLCETAPTAEQKNNMGCPIVYVLPIKYHSIRWLLCGLWRRIARSLVYPNFLLDPLGNMLRTMRKYDVVCVMSEGSIFRNIVSSLPSEVRKVQLIHTNYRQWRKHSDCSRMITYKDDLIYSRMDVIGVVGKIGMEEFQSEYYRCRGKVFAFYNMLEKVHDKCWRQNPSKVVLVTIARIEDKEAKDGDRMLRVARRIKNTGIAYTWDIYGSSEKSMAKYNSIAEKYGISECFKVHSYSPDVFHHMAKADVLVLLSHYEGLPNVVYESFQVGTPVFATSVGGVPEQIKDGYNGWLVEDDEETICSRLRQVLQDYAEIERLHQNLADYTYDNNVAMRSHMRLLGVEGR